MKEYEDQIENYNDPTISESWNRKEDYGRI
jgi:hypothetical protein